MLENQFHLYQKHHENQSLQQQDKDVFNKQALEDKLHSEKVLEERRRWKEWQKDSLKNNYEEQIKNREFIKRIEREKEKAYADEYKYTVEKYEHDHYQTLDNRRRKNEQVLNEQLRTVIPDVNDKRKRDAIENMHRQFESTERNTLKNELDRLNRRFNYAKETDSVLKQQMDIKKFKEKQHQMNDKDYKQYMDSTINMLSENDRRRAEETKRLKESYAKELENQIKEHNEKEKTTFNEMDDRNFALNQKGLVAYENGDRNNKFKLPGIDRDDFSKRENFARYARNKPSSKRGSEGLLSHRNGGIETMSYRSNNNVNALPYVQNKYKDLPKTTMKESGNRSRRFSRGIGSPSDEYYAVNPLTEREPAVLPQNGLAKYKSMAELEVNLIQKPSQDKVDMPKALKIVSPRQRNEAEYEPMKRSENEKRALKNNEVAKSLSRLQDIEVTYFIRLGLLT